MRRSPLLALLVACGRAQSPPVAAPVPSRPVGPTVAEAPPRSGLEGESWESNPTRRYPLVLTARGATVGFWLAFVMLMACTRKDQASAATESKPMVQVEPDSASARADGGCRSASVTVDGAPVAVTGGSAVTIVDSQKRDVAAQLLLWLPGGRAMTCKEVGETGWPSGPRYVQMSVPLSGARRPARTWVAGMNTGKSVEASIAVDRSVAGSMTFCVHTPVAVLAKWDGAEHRVVIDGDLTGDDCGARSW